MLEAAVTLEVLKVVPEVIPNAVPNEPLAHDAVIVKTRRHTADKASDAGSAKRTRTRRGIVPGGEESCFT